MKSVRTFTSLFLICVLLLLVPISALADPKSNKELSFVVHVKDHLLTVKVRDISLKKVLEEIANQAWIRIVFYGPSEKMLLADFSDIPLDKGLKRLIRDINYAFIYRPKKINMMESEVSEIIICPKTGEGRIERIESTVITPKQQAIKELREAFLIYLFKALEDKDPVVREEVVGILSELKDQRIIKHLTAILLNDKDEDVRAKAAKALGDFGDQRAIDPLREALQDKEAWVRENVVEALRQIGGNGVISPLIETLGDEDKDVKNAAAYALEHIIE